MFNMSYDLKQPVIHSQGIVNATHTSLCVFNVCLMVVSIAQVRNTFIMMTHSLGQNPEMQPYLARSVSTTLGKIVMTLMPCSFNACTNLQNLSLLM